MPGRLFRVVFRTGIFAFGVVFNRLFDAQVHVVIDPQPDLPAGLRVVQEVVGRSGRIKARITFVEQILGLYINQKMVAKVEPNRRIPGAKCRRTGQDGGAGGLGLPGDGLAERRLLPVGTQHQFEPVGPP